jgi:hypothetical protein
MKTMASTVDAMEFTVEHGRKETGGAMSPASMASLLKEQR